MDRLKVTAIVVTYNRIDLLVKVINALIVQTYPIDSILIIDNNSSDDTGAIVNDSYKENKKIRYYNTGGNLGGAGGFHFGFKKAEDLQYDFLWLMDDDLVPEVSCLENLIDSSDTGIVQPVRYNIDNSCAELSPVEYDLDSFFILNPKKRSVTDCYEELEKKSLLDIHGVPFEGPLIHKNVVKEIGYPNTNFFIFYDDLDYSIRARNAGFKIRCVYKAKALRLLKNNQSNDLKSWKGYFMLRNLFYIHRQYGENFFVRQKPFLLAFSFCLLSLLRLDIKQSKVVIRAFLDYPNLQNSDKHKP